MGLNLSSKSSIKIVLLMVLFSNIKDTKCENTLITIPIPPSDFAKILYGLVFWIKLLI